MRATLRAEAEYREAAVFRLRAMVGRNQEATDTLRRWFTVIQMDADRLLARLQPALVVQGLTYVQTVTVDGEAR